MLLFCGCEPAMMDYEGKVGVYFNVQKVPIVPGDQERYEHIDTTLFSFSDFVGDTRHLLLNVRLLGNIESVDRYFNVRVVEDTSTTAEEGTDYEMLNKYPIPANERDGFVAVDIFRTDKLSDTTMYLTIELVENETFALPMKTWVKLPNDNTPDKKAVNVIRHVIGFTNVIVMPRAYSLLIWGDYSLKKMQLILDVCGLTMEDFADPNVFTSGVAKIHSQRFNKYLKAMKAKGETVYEADGVTEMAVGNQGV